MKQPTDCAKMFCPFVSDADRLREIDRQRALKDLAEHFGTDESTISRLCGKMNLALIDPFQLAQDYPDCLTNELSKLLIVSSRQFPAETAANNKGLGSGHATILRFNRKGDYLASGRVRIL